MGISSARSTTLNSVKSTGFLNAGGGAISEITSGGISYRVHTFIETQNFVVTKGSGIVEYLIVGGGGSGGYEWGGGGGAGGFLEGMLTLSSLGSYQVVVGAGGPMSSTAPMISGNSSSFNGIVAIGGGAGGSHGQGFNGLAGGSGGGGAIADTQGQLSIGGIATSGQGNNGGTGAYIQTALPGGGGGGAGAAGGNGTSGSNGGAGGIGKPSSINGTTTYYSGGGGGGAYETARGLGGLGGGGNGAKGSNATASTPGTANSGGGGGGSNYLATRNSSGGSGIVILRYRIA
jgi:hypothetical protein